MALPVAVSDTSVLIAIHHLDLLQSLSLLYSKILVPAPVRVEFLLRDDERSRKVALDTLSKNEFFSPCDEFDSVQVGLYKDDKMQGAEAEALSQMILRNADVLLIDEKIGRNVATKEQRRVQGTLSILAHLHTLGLTNFNKSVQRLQREINFRVSERTVADVRRRILGKQEV
jgi:predicted nucleic acid-binding protein